MWNSLRFIKSVSRLQKTLQNSRTFMSDGFSCTKIWDKRLLNSLLKKVKAEEMYCELDNKFIQNSTVSFIDIDILANSINGDDHIRELEDIIHKFRLSAEAWKILPSTHHAFIRVFNQFDEPDNLLRILNDRLNYGIFPDAYCNVLLIDRFIKENDFKRAAKIAILQMLQENFTDPLFTYLSLYSCHKYLLEPDEWDEIAEEEVKEEEEEDVKRVRVKYLRNPYFDNHFDLQDRDSLIGKTLFMIGNNLSDPTSISYQLLGSVLFQKYEAAKTLIDTIIKENIPIYEGCLDLASQSLRSLPAKEGEEGNKTQEQITSMISAIEALKSNINILKEDPTIHLEQQIKKIVSETESDLITQQEQIYEKWITDREEILTEELNELNRQTRLKDVEARKKELAEKEEELFFFDHQDKLDIIIESKRVPYPKKWHGKKKKKRADNVDYIPPEVKKQLLVNKND